MNLLKRRVRGLWIGVPESEPNAQALLDSIAKSVEEGRPELGFSVWHNGALREIVAIDRHASTVRFAGSASNVPWAECSYGKSIEDDIGVPEAK